MKGMSIELIQGLDKIKKRHTFPKGNQFWRKGVHRNLKGEESPMYGRHHSEETKKKISLSRLLFLVNNPDWKKVVFTPERNKKISISNSGSNHYNWKGGPKIPKDIKNRIRKLREYKDWRHKVFTRDNYTCQECMIRSGNGKEVYLEAHHIKSFADYPELRYLIENGITLCKNCHKKINKLQMMGNKNGNKK